MSHTVSVLIPNYNHAGFLPDCIRSVMEQSRPADEVIIIDDCSTDHSVEVIEDLKARYPIIKSLKNETNLGVVRTMERLVAHATGDYLSLMAADDIFMTRHLDESMSLLSRHPEAGFCSGLTRIIGENGEDLGPDLIVPIGADGPTYLSPEASRLLLSKAGLWVYSNTAVFRREALVQLGGFRTELHSFADGFACMVLALRHGACYIPDYLGARRVLATSYSQGTYANPGRFLEYVSNASELMRTQYRDLFPSGFADNWEREVLFGFGLLEHQRLRADQLASLERLSKVGIRAGLANRFGLSLLSLSLGAQSALFKLGLFLSSFPKFTVRRTLVRYRNALTLRPTNHS